MFLQTLNRKTLVLACVALAILGTAIVAFMRPEIFTGNKTKLMVSTLVINNDGGTAVESDFTSTVTAEGIDPRTMRGSKNELSIGVQPGNFRIDTQLDSRYYVSTVGDCSGSIAENETKKCVVTYNDIPSRVTVETKTEFKATASAFADSKFTPLIYTLERIEKINNTQNDQPEFFKNVSYYTFTRNNFPEGTVAVALTIQIKNPNEFGVEGTNYTQPSMQKLALVSSTDGKSVEQEPIQVVDASTVEVLSSKEVIAIFSVPQFTKSIQVSLGYKKNPLIMEIDFEKSTAVVIQEQDELQNLSDVPGCQNEHVSISGIRLYTAGGQFVPNKTLQRGQKAYIEYTWKGGGDVKINPPGIEEKIWGSYQAWMYIAPIQTTTYTLTPTADTGCSTQFTVNVY